MRVADITEITEIPASAAALGTTNEVCCSREWLHFCEYHDYSDPCHLVAYADPDARQVSGVFPGFEIRYEGNPRYQPAEALRETIAPELSGAEAWFPGLVLGARAGNGNALLLDPQMDAATRDDTLRALCDAAGELARGRGLNAMWYMYLQSDEAALLRPFWPGRRIHLTEVDMVIPITGPTFDDYLAQLSRNRRTAVRRERRKFEQSGADVRHVPFTAEVCELVAPLLGKMQDRFGMHRTNEWLADRLRHQAAAMGDLASVLLLYRDGELIAFDSLFRYKGEAYSSSIGVDYDKASPFDYFNMAYYEPLLIAAENGDTALNMGVSAVQAKILRGARPRPMWSLVSSLDPEADARYAEAEEKLLPARLTQLKAEMEVHVQNLVDDTEWAVPGEPA